MHLKRWITGIVALPVLIYLIGFAPRWLFYGFLALAAVVGFLEFLRMSAPEMPGALRWPAFLLVPFLFLAVLSGRFYAVPAVFSLAFMLPLVICLFAGRERRENALHHAALCLSGLVYVGLPLAMLVFIDNHPQGGAWIFFLLAVIFASDTGAFYSGRIFGRVKLHPDVSPGKTWEGAVGGALASLVPVYFFYPFLHAGKASVFFLALGLSVTGQIGDLAESMIKRTFGVKDSGSILPGHGGLLDRIDGLIFAVPVLYVVLAW